MARRLNPHELLQARQDMKALIMAMLLEDQEAWEILTRPFWADPVRNLAALTATVAVMAGMVEHEATERRGMEATEFCETILFPELDAAPLEWDDEDA